MFQKCFKGVKKEVSKYLKGIPMLFYKTSKVGSRIFYKLFQERMSQNVLKDVLRVFQGSCLLYFVVGWQSLQQPKLMNGLMNEEFNVNHSPHPPKCPKSKCLLLELRRPDLTNIWKIFICASFSEKINSHKLLLLFNIGQRGKCSP